MIRQVEDLCSKFHVLPLAHRELLIDRGIEVGNAWTYDRVPRGVAVTILRSKWKPVHKCVSVEKVSPRSLASGKVRVGSRRIGVTLHHRSERFQSYIIR